MRRSLLALFICCSVLLAGCGDDSSSDDGGDPADEGQTDDSAASDDDATDDGSADDGPVDDSAADAAADDDPVDGAATDDAPAGSDGVAVSLGEYFVDMADSIEGGTVSFEVVNDGSASHQLTVVRADGYEALPQLDNGGVDGDALAPADIVGATENVRGGESTTLTVDLEPGNYVFYCDIGAGPTSHAGRGQHLDVAVG